MSEAGAGLLLLAGAAAGDSDLTGSAGFDGVVAAGDDSFLAAELLEAGVVFG